MVFVVRDSDRCVQLLQTEGNELMIRSWLDELGIPRRLRRLRGGGSDRQLTSSEFHRWVESLESGQKIVEAVELGKESDLRSLGPYHQESIGGSFGPNGYNVAGRNVAAS